MSRAAFSLCVGALTLVAPLPALAQPDAGVPEPTPPHSDSDSDSDSPSPSASDSDSAWDSFSDSDTGAADDEGYGARARVSAVRIPGARRLELEEMRDLPGAFGDPFRAIDALPGVVPIISGLPYFYVRGSPPSGTLYIYDDIPVPSLYHLAIGPAVIHPRMVGPIRLYSGVAPARYGRLIGGVVVGEGPGTPPPEPKGEFEIRLLDISGFIQAPAPVVGGTVSAAVRYGYPALLLSLLVPEISFAYWDYQLRYDRAFSSQDRIEVVALGSYDSFSTEGQEDSALILEFHRIEPRFIRRFGTTDFGAALLFGWERSQLGQDFLVESVRVGPRIWLEHRFGAGRLRIGADMVGVAGSIGRPQPREPGVEPTDGPSGDAVYDAVPGRSLSGIHAELVSKLSPAIELQLGGRFDAWITARGVTSALDPRGRVILHANERLDFHVGAGVVRQPAVFFIPLPGIADVALDRGLQTAIQSEAGVSWESPWDLIAEAQLFAHHYSNLLFLEGLFVNQSTCVPAGDACDDPVPDARTEGTAYGAELFLRRPPGESLSGWISYTLSFARVDDVAGLPYLPTWDVRHVLNFVLSWNIGAGFSVGTRLHARSGKPSVPLAYDRDGRIDAFYEQARYQQRLPWFVRLDAQVAYAWETSWGRLRLSLEWFNTTISREPSAVVCEQPVPSLAPTTPCPVQYIPAIFFPNLGVRGEF